MVPDWLDLGRELLNKDEVPHLYIIKENHRNDNRQCRDEMFTYWLRTHPEASWQQLIESLGSPALKLHTVAADIKAMCLGKLAKFYLIQKHPGCQKSNGQELKRPELKSKWAIKAGVMIMLMRI